MALALIVDDEVDLCRLMQITLKKMQIDTLVAYDYATAVNYLAQQPVEFCLTDLRLPDGSGLDIVKLIAKNYPSIPVAVITAHGNMDLAIESLKLGAFDFVNKPLELPRLRQLVENALKVAQDTQAQNADTPTDPFSTKLIGQSESILTLKKTIQKLARSQAPVFLCGESGTGKEVVAKFIHQLSPRSHANFVPVNCGAIPSELMESEFFGHKKGSFTGATADKEGLFQQANGGTLFLDEVADLPLAMQVKLLRAIQEKKVRPVGSTQEIAVDVRLLSATHKNLVQLVELGQFRQDLYYRINVIEVKLPNLNERKADIPLLAEHFLQLIAEDWGLSSPLELTATAMAALLTHHYSGNVRELRNILERAITLADDHVIDIEHLNLPQSNANTIMSAVPTNEVTPSSLVANTSAANTSSAYGNHSRDANITIYPSTNHLNPANSFNIATHTPTPTAPPIKSATAIISAKLGADMLADTDCDNLPPEGLEEYLTNQERRLILTALNQSGGNKTQAAKLLNTSFRSLRYRMKKLEIGGEED